MPLDLTPQEEEKIRRDIDLGLQDRKRYEPLWQECLAFAAGRQWVRWEGRVNRQLVAIPQKQGMDRYTIDELAQYRQTVLGELSLDDDRPQLLFRHDKLPEQDYAQMANDAVAYGWDYEWMADERLLDVRRHVVDVGTGAIRCYFDPTLGPVRTQVPMGQDGAPIYDKSKAMDLIGAGATLDFQTIHEGRTVWQTGSPFNLITPPGVTHEKDFPWECWVEPVYIPSLMERFGAAALGNIQPDGIAPLSSIQPDEQNNVGQARRVQLKDHAWLYTYYRRPSAKYPQGFVVYLVSKAKKIVKVDGMLPYEAPSGERRSGIHYFHYIRLSNRFWSRGMMELGLQPARAYSKRRTQMAAIFDRGQPKVIAQEGTLKKMPEGYPAEMIWLKPGQPQPQTWQGLQPSGAMYQELEMLRTDLERAIGLRVALGENPQNVTTYSQLALLREQETRKLDITIAETRITIAHVVEDSVYDVKKYWPTDKVVTLAGPDGMLRAFEFNKTGLREGYYRVEAAKGAAKPRTQAAKLQMVTDIWNAALASNIARADPVSWMRWLKESYEQGQPVELPSTTPDYNATFAQYAQSLLNQGELPPVLDFIDPAVMIPAVRQVETDATLAGNTLVQSACRAYLQLLVQQKQMQMAQAQVEQAQQPGLALRAGAAPSLPTGPPPGAPPSNGGVPA